MTTHKETISIEVDVPDGYRAIGRGHAKEGQPYIADDGRMLFATLDHRELKTILLEKLPEPYVFPDWMPDGWWLKKISGRWCLYSNYGKETAEIHDWPLFTPPNNEQYVGEALRITHKK